MHKEFKFGDLIVDRAEIRALVRKSLEHHKLHVLGLWQAPIFRWHTPKGRIIAAAAVYRHSDTSTLFLWAFGRQFQWIIAGGLRRPPSCVPGGKWSW